MGPLSYLNPTHAVAARHFEVEGSGYVATTKGISTQLAARAMPTGDEEVGSYPAQTMSLGLSAPSPSL